MLASELGTEVALSYLFPATVLLFVKNIGLMLGVFDLLWVFLAAGVAWRIPKGVGIKH